MFDIKQCICRPSNTSCVNIETAQSRQEWNIAVVDINKTSDFKAFDLSYMKQIFLILCGIILIVILTFSN